MDPTTAALEKEHEAITKVKYIDRIQIGKYYCTTFIIITIIQLMQKESHDFQKFVSRQVRD